MTRLLQGAGLFALARGALAAPYVSEAQTTVSAEATFTNPAIPHANVTSHGPYEGTPTTTGALSTKVLAPSIEPLPPGPDAYKYPADGKLHGDQPAPYTPSGGIGTNGSAPVYRVNSDFDYQSLSLALFQEWIELDLFHWGLATFSEEEFDAYTSRPRTVTCSSSWPSRSGLFPMPVWFEVGIPQSWAWTLLAPYISSCPADTQRLIWQNFPLLHILNQPNPARIDGANVWNETTGGYANTLSTAEIEPEDACINATEVGEFCGAAISRNRTTPLSYPGRQVFLQWDAPGSPVGPNNSYITATEVREPKFAAWVSQLNVTYSPLLNVSLEDRTAYTIQPNVSTIEGDPALNGTLFLALTDEPLYVTPYNLTQINPHVAALALYQAG
ncbi:rds1 [Verticillium alfalfae VaMs.102]|uniref:Rds1 n=1 Tax=Verticillium alfalfae (strain VaMs.102 / ATCC MYA-4576 / FGSC 10136) TaxID=526221 RepID=C9SQT7_VERA1|nr:rds1 [Verticillium alfalfae VaMs.102]EEY21212.1 rds1 [Verticillium alfalfae VaMs.102]